VYKPINPKAVTRNELYGYLHPSTREWKEGLVSVTFRDMANNSTNKHQWIVLDGDIDAGVWHGRYSPTCMWKHSMHKQQATHGAGLLAAALLLLSVPWGSECDQLRLLTVLHLPLQLWLWLPLSRTAEWIESMNTVMDDNKMLTLASNERIPLTPSMRLLLEINHMNHCSPATVSRGGVIFVNVDDVGWKPVVDSWIEKLEVSSPPALRWPPKLGSYSVLCNKSLRH
jgi:hypothetical protein